MKSLRTDDIIGATPKVRHMPKNLLRQRKNYPINHSISFQTEEHYYKYNGKWDHSYNQNMYENFPLNQYDPNPFIKQTNRNKYDLEAYKADTNIMNKEQAERIRKQQYQPYFSRSQKFGGQRDQLQSLSIIGGRQMKAKQALIINCGQLEPLKQLRKMNNQSPAQTYNKQKYSQRENHLQAIDKRRMVDQNPQGKQINLRKYQAPQVSDLSRSIISRRSQNIEPLQQNRQRSSSSLNSPKHTDKQQRNIFRGLGFNIITNSKYQFNLQTKNPYVKRDYN